MPAARYTNYFLTGPRLSYWDNVQELQDIVDNDPNIKYLSIGRHTGEKTGYEHVHINLEYWNKRAWTSVKKQFGPEFDIQPRKGRRVQADNYLKKQELFRVVAELGTDNSGSGHRSDIDEFDQLVKQGTPWPEIVELCPSYTAYSYHCAKARYNDLLSKDARVFKMDGASDVEVRCYFGPTGCGKTWACTSNPKFAEPLGDGYWRQLPSAEKMGYSEGKLWWDGCTRITDTIFMDEFNGGWMPFSQFCQIVKCTGPPARLEVKGSFTWPQIKLWLITSIRHPNQWWPTCKDFTINPGQLWRRIDHVYWCDGLTEDGEWSEPVELDKRKFREMNEETYKGWMEFGRKKWCELYGTDTMELINDN